MLVLMHKNGDAVYLTDRKTGKVLAKVTQLGIHNGSRARMGYEADRDIVIDREVIYWRKLEQREAAAVPANDEGNAHDD